MTARSRSHLSDSTLLRTLADHLRAEHGSCADVLADLAEVDVRRLYVPAGFESLFEFCVRHLRFTREKAFKRIRAARAARRFPVILDLVADGRLSVTAVVLLASHLTEDNATDLLAEASGRTIEQIELLLAERFPRPDLPTRIEPLPAAPAPAPAPAPTSGNSLSLRTVEEPAAGHQATELSLRTVEEPAAAHPVAELSSRTVQPPAPRPRIIPLAPERFAIQCTVPGSTHDKLRRAQELLRRDLPGGDVAGVLDRALDALIEKLEKRAGAATSRPRKSPPGAASRNPRHVPAAVKRAVWKRDGGRCTFVSANGRRCEARGGLEYDHEHPVARGGRSSPGNLRLRCRAHNQLEAERLYGADFMRHKREAAAERSREATAERTREAAAEQTREAGARAPGGL